MTAARSGGGCGCAKSTGLEPREVQGEQPWGASRSLRLPNTHDLRGRHRGMKKRRVDLTQSQHSCQEVQSKEPPLLRAAAMLPVTGVASVRATLLEPRNQGVFARVLQHEAVDVLAPVVFPPSAECSRLGSD